jgi:hypothetical protein
MELVTAGGNYAASEVVLPNGFPFRQFMFCSGVACHVASDGRSRTTSATFSTRYKGRDSNRYSVRQAKLGASSG